MVRRRRKTRRHNEAAAPAVPAIGRDAAWLTGSQAGTASFFSPFFSCRMQGAWIHHAFFLLLLLAAIRGSVVVQKPKRPFVAGLVWPAVCRRVKVKGRCNQEGAERAVNYDERGCLSGTQSRNMKLARTLQVRQPTLWKMINKAVLFFMRCLRCSLPRLLSSPWLDGQAWFFATLL